MTGPVSGGEKDGETSSLPEKGVGKDAFYNREDGDDEVLRDARILLSQVDSIINGLKESEKDSVKTTH